MRKEVPDDFGDLAEQSLILFAVYDHQVEAFLQPFFMRTAGEAIRAFTDTVNDPSTMFFKHPEDYTLFRIGRFGVSTGCVISCKTPEPVRKAFELLDRFGFDAGDDIPAAQGDLVDLALAAEREG